jgi:hypothetical protein
VKIFTVRGDNVSFERTNTTVEFTTSDVQVVGKPWVLDSETLLVIAVIKRAATPGSCDVVVQTNGEECVLEDGLLIATTMPSTSSTSTSTTSSATTTTQTTTIPSFTAPYWGRTYGGSEYDVANSIQQTADGGYIVSGSTDSFGSYRDHWILKLDGGGNVSWQKTYGGFPSGWTDTQQTSDGGYIVAGQTYTAPLGKYSSSLDVLVLKLDGAGDVSWQKAYGGRSRDAVNSVRQTADGGYILVGSTHSFEADHGDPWILKLDSVGNVSWQKAFGRSGEDLVSPIQQTTDGGYIVAGNTVSPDAPVYDFWVMKLDSAGNVSWQKSYQDSDIGRAMAIGCTADGGCVLAGFMYSLEADDYDFWVMKLDSAGNVSWQKSYGGGFDDVAQSVHPTAEGGYVVAGYTDSFGDGYRDLWVLKLDGSGNVSWQKTYGGSRADLARSVEQTADGGYVVAGSTNSFGVGNDDFFVLKLDANGEIPGCSIMATTDGTVLDTSLALQDSESTVLSTAISITDMNLSHQDSSALISTVCENQGEVEEPNAVNLSQFTATPRRRQVRLNREAASEVDSVGLNISRSKFRDGLIHQAQRLLDSCKRLFLTRGLLWVYR